MQHTPDIESTIVPAYTVSTSKTANKSLVDTAPHPKKKQLALEYNADNLVDSVVIATWSTTNKFDSKMATFKIRRPYCNPLVQDKEEGDGEREFWNDFGVISEEEYITTASVEDYNSLEMAVIIKANKSVLQIFASRYRLYTNKEKKTAMKLLHEHKWNESGINQEKVEIEVEYSLDKILAEAQSIRKQYCSSLLSKSTALKMQERPQQQLLQPLSPELVQEVQRKMLTTYDQPESKNVLISSRRTQLVFSPSSLKGSEIRIAMAEEKDFIIHFEGTKTASIWTQHMKDSVTTIVEQLVVSLLATKKGSMEKVLEDLVLSLFCIIWYETTNFSPYFFQEKRKKSPKMTVCAISLCAMAWYFCYKYYHYDSKKSCDEIEENVQVNGDIILSSIVSSLKMLMQDKKNP